MKEIIVRSQDGSSYREFKFPIHILDSNWGGYTLAMGGTTFADYIGKFDERKHAVHVMNYLISKRNFYMYDSDDGIKSVILIVPTDEVVKQTPDENLLDGIPVKKDEEVSETEESKEEGGEIISDKD